MGPERGSALVLRQVVVNRVGIALKIGLLAKAIGRRTVACRVGWYFWWYVFRRRTADAFW